jgi:hypothetical protein
MLLTRKVYLVEEQERLFMADTDTDTDTRKKRSFSFK